MEKRTKARGQDAPKEQFRQTRPHSSIQHQRVDARLGEDASEAEVKNDKVSNCGTEWKNAHSQ